MKKGLPMKRYVVRRLLMAIPLLLAISFVCFCFINLIPSNPAEVALRVQQTPVITDEIIAAMEEQLGLNKPFFVRYFDWVLGCLHGDFGISYVNPKRTVAGELLRCLPATLQLAGTSFVIVAVLSIPICFLCAVYKDGWFDKIMRGLVFVTTAMPAYWVGLLLMWGIGVKLNWLPTNGNGTWRHLILPSFTVALSYISTYIRLIRNNMLENMKQDYVLYANVRGLPQKSILVKHILKNSMHTCIVAMGMSIPQLISGTIVVENVFSWPGLGTARNGSYSWAAQKGIPALLLERGGNGRWTSEEVDADCEDVLRLMNHLGIRKEAFDAVPQTEIAKAVYEEAPADGYWFPEVCAGQEVLKDALLGRWKSSDGTQNCEVRARFAGRVLYETTALGVRRSDPLVAYGTA